MNPLLSGNIYWHLPILIVVISLVQGATRFESWRSIFVEAFRWGLRMTIFLISVAAVLTILAYVI
jgi:hypothetical protein